MSAVEWLVLFAGLAGIGAVNWYFFVAGRSQPTAAAVIGGTGTPGNEVPEVVITVDGGYAPSIVHVRVGQTVKLVFDRKDNSSCSEEVVFPDFSIRKYLPMGTRTIVEITPPTAGRYEFMCGMSMLRGVLIAEDKEAS